MGKSVCLGHVSKTRAVPESSDSFSGMSLILGRPPFINQDECTISAPLDCVIPQGRHKTVPVARSQHDKPTPVTERLLRLALSKRSREIRDLELEGPIPRNPDKV